LTANMEYFHSVPRAPRWFTPSSLKTTVRIQQIVHPNLNLVEISETNMLPNGCNKRSARQQGAKRVSQMEHDEILEDITRRAILEHEEDSLDEEEIEDTADGDESDEDENDEEVSDVRR